MIDIKGRKFNDIVKNFEKYIESDICKFINQSCKYPEIEKYRYMLFERLIITKCEN